MRSLITITLCISLAFATTIKQECKPICMKDCTEVGREDVGNNCVMMFGMGPDGPGWYWFDDEGSDHVGNPMPSRTCQDSCTETCDNLCKQGGDGQPAEDRGYGYGRGYGGYGRRGYYG